MIGASLAMNDNPEHLVGMAERMAAFGAKDKAHPWWAMAASVGALAQVAADSENPLSEPALVAMQIMATVFNKRIGE